MSDDKVIEGPGFTVTDRRGEAKDDAGSPEEGGGLPQLDFSTLLISWGTSALVHLGEAPSPDGETHKDLPLAKHTIDMLEVLASKTKGNLSEQEDALLKQLLYDLRLRYVAALK